MTETRPDPEAIAFPVLTAEEIEDLEPFAACNVFADGEHLFRAGDVDFKFYVVVEGSVEILESSSGDPRRVTLHGVGEFTGDVDMLSRKAALVTAVARGRTKVYEVPCDDLQNLVAELPVLGEKILRAFIARRELLLESEFEGLKVIGPGRSSGTLKIREFLAKNQVPFTWLDPEKEEDIGTIFVNFGIGQEDMPVVIHEDRWVFRNPTVASLSEALNIRRSPEQKVYDLIIVGAGPAGLAAAVYGASEGLSTVVLEQIGPGGQAGTSSKIENYLGFPTGLSGSELAERAILQAQKFGARLSSPSRVTGIETPDHGDPENGERTIRVRLDNGETVEGKSLLIATGASYRQLGAEGRERFEGSGVYYAATHLEAQLCSDIHVAVVGGGNSAGQAAVYLAGTTERVYLLLRGKDLRADMSSYLADRIEGMENIDVRLSTEIVRMEGEEHLERIVLESREQPGTSEAVDVGAVFTFIGAQPCTEWLPDSIARDAGGFILTGREAAVNGSWPSGMRPPFYLETSIPGIFAAGDVRSDSIKRVASAVGEGSMAIKFIHEHIGENSELRI